MKWSRFIFGVATGVIASYLLTRKKNDPFLKPEQIVQALKHRYQDSMSIIGSWIHIEPQLEEVEGVRYHTYNGGLTGHINGEPTFLEFKVDAQTGNVLQVNQ